jgi:pyridoxine kinase
MSMQHDRAILSIQSAVSFGHVGNSAAVFPLQRLGFEVWPINTLQFSNHPGYGGFRGRIFPADHIAELTLGLAERGVLAACDGVLSGYLGDPATGDAVLDAVARVKAANPAALYCCDPVIGDGGAVYVRRGVAEFFAARGVKAADILTPNQFELQHLTGVPAGSLTDAIAAARTLIAADTISAGPRIVLVTSLAREGALPEMIEMLAVERDAAWLVATPRLVLTPNGAGDAVAALFLGHFLKTCSAPAALGAAASAIFAILDATAAAGARELRLVAAQDVLLAPARRFAAERVA